MQVATVCFLIRKSAEGHTEVCLAEKKRGYGAGNLVGPGGKIETTDWHSWHTTVREIGEEMLVKIRQEDLKPIAVLTTYSPNDASCWRVEVFTCERWVGEPQETEECGPPEWFRVDELPVGRMFADCKYWLRSTLDWKGEAPRRITVLYEKDGKTVAAVFFADDPGLLRHRYL